MADRKPPKLPPIPRLNKPAGPKGPSAPRVTLDRPQLRAVPGGAPKTAPDTLDPPPPPVPISRRSVTRRPKLADPNTEVEEREPERVRLAPGQLVPGTRYKLQRWLGDGGMGVVYSAEHMDLGRIAALKILRPTLTRNTEATEAFRAEARTVNKVGSRNIIEIYDFAELPDGRLLFAMEFLDGPTLAEVIDEGEPMPPERAIPILRQMARGLAAVHAAGIVHRDVKPQNVVLVQDEEGRDDLVKILDFGISAMLADPDTACAAGTVVYMAPEQIEGRAVDPRMDMYSLGCMAYEMLCTDPPFLPDTIEALIEMQRSATPRPLVDRVEGLPPELDEIVLKCLEKRPDDRYANMRELEAALCEAQLALGIHTPWDDLPAPDVDPDRKEMIARGFERAKVPATPTRPRWQWLAAGALGVALAIGGGVYIGANSEVPLEARNEVEELTFAARTAASRAFFVYPPSEDPTLPTAYAFVQKLDLIHGDATELASSRADALRAEFAGTLVRLGDDYWERPGGETFALDYYAQALVFDPEIEPARERASLTPGELANLRRKAGTLEFSERELEAVEPLIALAEPDVETRVKKLEKIRDKKGHRSASTQAHLSEILETEKKRTSGTKVAVAEPSAKPPPTTTDEDPGSTDTSDATPSEEPASTGKKPGATEDEDARRPEQAKALAEKGHKALSRRKYTAAETLFSRALSHDNRNTSALVGLSDVHFERGAYRKSVGFAKRAVALAPRNAGYRVRLGDAYFKVLRYQDARAQYVKAKDLGSGQAAKRIAMVDKKLGQ